MRRFPEVSQSFPFTLKNPGVQFLNPPTATALRGIGAGLDSGDECGFKTTSVRGLEEMLG